MDQNIVPTESATHALVPAGGSLNNLTGGEPTLSVAAALRQTILEPLKRDHTLAIWLLVLIVCGVGQQVLIPVVLRGHIPDYPYTFAIVMNTGFLPGFFVPYLVRRYWMKVTTPEQCNVPHWVLLILGLLNAGQGVAVVFASPHVPSMLQALLGVSVVSIPMSLLVTAVFLKARYWWGHVLASTLIIGGVLVSLAPSLQHGSGDQSGSLSWDVFYTLSSIFVVVAAVVVEYLCGNSDIDVWFLASWVNLYSMIGVIAAAPLQFVAWIGVTTESHFLQHNWEGLQCLFGKRDFDPSECPECNCDYTWLLLLAEMVAYVGANVASMAIIKNANSAFQFVALALIVPLSAVCFALPPNIIGRNVHQPFSAYTGAAVFIILAGMVWYRVVDIRASASRAKLDVGAKGKETKSGGAYGGTDTDGYGGYWVPVETTPIAKHNKRSGFSVQQDTETETSSLLR